LRLLWRLVGWFVVVDALITVFGVTTAPLLLFLALDTVVGLLVIRSYMEMRTGFPVALVTVPKPGYREGG
jgi:predicted tellurium resistance membrane protein TerC